MRQNIAKYFNERELRDLCFNLGVDYENLEGSEPQDKARELVAYFERRISISELVKACEQLRPDISWGEAIQVEDIPPVLETPQPEQITEDHQQYKNIVVEALTLQDYPWEIHKQIRDSGVPTEQSYINSWKYIIWVLLAKKFLSFSQPASYKLIDPLFWRSGFDANIRYLHRFLEQNYGDVAPSFGELIADRARQIRSLKVKDFEIGTGGDQDPSQRLSHSINFANHEIQSRLLAVLPKDKRYYLLFDQLDLGWDATEESKQLLIGLILAARDVERATESAGKQIRVILFLRSDIYESLRFEDKNKLSPSVVELTWNEQRLKQLVSKRIETSTGGTWEDVFSGQQMEGDISQLSYIAERTMFRPRDMIQFCTCTKEAALRLDRDKIDNDSIREACRPYSDYMRKEIQDECKASLPDIDNLLTLLKEIGFERITAKQFIKDCKSKGIANAETVLRQLIELSIVGICRGKGRGLFRYQAQPWEHLDPTQEIVIHPSLKHALRLAEPRK